MTQLLIVGAGGFGNEVAMICDEMLKVGTASFDRHAFLDDNGAYLAARGRVDRLAGSIQDHKVDPQALYVCSIGNSTIRRRVVTRLEDEGARFATIIHPLSQIADSATIGAGSVVAFGGGVYPFAKVGRHVHINAYSGLGHDAEVADFCTLSAHVDITGGASIGEGVFFGTHSAVLPNKRVGAGATIGAGCIVIRNVGSQACIYEDPPKFLRRGV